MGRANEGQQVISSWRLEYRPALDGLRGVAIAMVVIAHTGVPYVSTLGSTGVTLFFVLSGFLITGLLAQERAARGRVDLRAFAVRRVRRLAPALIALIVVVIVARAFLGPWWFEWRDLPPVLFFYGNWVEAFSPTPGLTLGALGITWSLAIEEQFYLLWPLILVLTRRNRRLFVVALVLAAASLAVRLMSEVGDIARVYYGTDTAAFALLAGAAAVLYRLDHRAGPSRRWLLIVAAVVVAWSLTWPDFVGVRLGTPIIVFASLAAVWACAGPAPVRALEGSVLRWLGTRSYGLYLWHGPLLGAMREYYHVPWYLIALIGVPISLVLAELSYRYIESPWRARSRPGVTA